MMTNRYELHERVLLLTDYRIWAWEPAISKVIEIIERMGATGPKEMEYILQKEGGSTLHVTESQIISVPEAKEINRLKGYLHEEE